MISFRLPEINAPTTDGQLRQLRSYLYQLTEQLNLAMESVDDEISKQNQTVSDAVAASDTPEGKLKTFNSVKALIIKSADIINAYTDEITRQLDGQYVAQSEFGTYMETTSQQIAENSTSIVQLFRNLQTISDTVDSIEETSILANAYIKTGLLYYAEDGSPVYGLEIGQTNTVDGAETFDKFARFAANRLSFYDNNDVEVAYISDYRLVITNAEVKGSLTVGKFKFDTANGLAIKWVGGE
jgi:hypothetical protein